MLSIDFHSRLDQEQLPSFTQRPTPWQTWLTQSMSVTDSRMMCLLPGSCLVHPVDHFDSKGCSALTRWYFKPCFVFLVKKACRILVERRNFWVSCFPRQCRSNSYMRWENKAYFDCLLSRQHFFQKLCNQTLYVKIIASQRWDVLLRHSADCFITVKPM